MGVVGKYFKREFRGRMFGLEYEDSMDFYLSCWQNNHSVLPMLIFRGILFLFSLSIVITSLVLSVSYIEMWLVFLTHWGLLLITIATGCATAVSAYRYFRKSEERNLTLPWYLKGFWVIYNMSVTTAFLITVFYWTFLTGVDAELDTDVSYAINPALDILIHAMNSIVMFLLLATSRIPCRILHFYQPVLFGILYMIFSLVYYFLGGIGLNGSGWIYPMLNWAEPGATLLMSLGTAMLIIVLYFAVVSMTLIRDVVTRCNRKNDDSLHISYSFNSN